ncbi:MAG: hypothetical protein Q7K43_05270 [Candidatus Woesearchaeota archaeon]|nr:hypothetical protein [Candidatus Woesearchaeota archaeon]
MNKTIILEPLYQLVEEHAKNCAPVLIKPADRGFFNSVIDLLRAQGFTPEIRGSVADNAVDGHWHQYNDIDILAKPTLGQIVQNFDLIVGLAQIATGATKLSEIPGYSNLPEDTIARVIGYAEYVCTRGTRLNLQSGNTTIDLLFGDASRPHQYLKNPHVRSYDVLPKLTS